MSFPAGFSMGRAKAQDILSLLTGLLTAASIGGAASADTDQTNGYWTSRLTGQGGSAEFQLTMIDDVGRLEAVFQNLGGIGYAACRYVFHHDGLVSSTVLLEQVQSFSKECPDGLSLSFERSEPSELSVSVQGLEFLDSVTMFGVLRPPLEDERYGLMDELDILGIFAGMSASEAEGILLDRGFMRSETMDRVVIGRGFAQEQRAYVKDDIGNGYWGQLIALGLSIVPEDAGEGFDPSVIKIRRIWNIQPEEDISGSALSNALQDKYGSAAVGNVIERSRTGEVLTTSRGRCRIAGLQNIPSGFSGVFTGGSAGNVFPGCGPVIDMSMRTNQDNQAIQLNIALLDTNLIWQNFWDGWSLGEHQSISAVIDSLDTSGPVPEL